MYKQVLLATDRYMCFLPKKSSCLSCVHQSNVHLPCAMTNSISCCLTSLSIFSDSSNPTMQSSWETTPFRFLRKNSFHFFLHLA